MSIKNIIFKEEVSKRVLNMSASVFMRVMFLGAVAGAITWLLSLALDRYMITPIFCTGQNNLSACVQSATISANIAAVLAGVMIVPILAMTRIRRALLVVVASVASLWGVANWIAGEWYVSLLMSVVVYALVFGALAWINRLRNGFLAFLLMVVFVVLARVVLSI